MRPALPHGGATLAVGLTRVSTAEQGHSGLGLEAQQASTHAAMAQKERELISERTRAALRAAKARGAALGGDRGYRPAEGPNAAAAAQARRVAAERAAYRLALEVERLRAEGVTGQAAIARALNERGVPTPRGSGAGTHTTVARVLARAAT